MKRAVNSNISVGRSLQSWGAWFILGGTSSFHNSSSAAAIAQLGERQTEDLKDPGSIPGLGT